MTNAPLWMIVPGQAALSALILIVIAVILLYFARHPVHKALLALGRIGHHAMRLAARSTLLAEKRLSTRNREVLLEAGREETARSIEREIERTWKVIDRDLGAYPSLHRRVSDELAKIEEDYQLTTETPPTPPAWLDTVKALSRVKAGDPTMGKLLEDIRDSLDKAQDRATDEYRKSTRERLEILKKIRPLWRETGRTLEQVNQKIAGIFEHSKKIDEAINKYEQIAKGEGTAVQKLLSSSFTQFFIAGFVLLIAAGGIVINFNLIAYPMQEMVGGNNYIGSIRTADVAALVIILMELAMGLFLMESLKITRLFPVIGMMDDRMRRRMLWTSFALLLILASIESSLAYMRDMLAIESAALRQSLAGAEALVPVQGGHWIPMAGQMIMGLVFPFALAFTAIPLESFVHALRTVLGLTATALLRIVAFVLRLIGTLFYRTALFCIALYDLLIFAPLWIEEKLALRKLAKETV